MASARSKLPLMVTLLAAGVALAIAAWLVFGVEPGTVEEAASVPVPPAAETPAPMPNPTPATTSTP
jgi:hypothetical protein